MNGYTMMHEHITIDLSGVKKDTDCQLDCYAETVEEFKKLYEYGVRRIVDVTNDGMGRNPQYVENVEINNCRFDTKDAFWHAKNVTIKDSVIKGEYLAWYSENLTFIDCTIKGTQPLCYCKGLKLINCRMEDCDLAFERSDVEATISTPVISIKNPLSGSISVPSVGEIIRDIPGADGKVITG